MDGNNLCIVRVDFLNLEESPAMFIELDPQEQEEIKKLREECDHNWIYDMDWKKKVRIDLEGLEQRNVLRIRQHCMKCKKESYELWKIDYVADRDTGEALQIMRQKND